MQNFLKNNCSCDTKNTSDHVIETHVRDILENTLQPVFKKQTQLHPTLTRKPEPKYRATYETELHEEQLWKQGNHVEILIWITENISTTVLEQNLPLIIPPVLIVLDDYDTLYKEQGVSMVHNIIKKLKSEYISRYGLDSVFFESMFKCLLYLSEERDIPLLKAAYPCILDIVATTKKDHARSDLYERVLKDGVITGFTHVGQKIKFLPILLQPISLLYDELGSIGVQYLKAVIPVLCDSLSMISSGNQIIHQINQLAASSLITVIKKCWPRIFEYKGLVMRSLAKAWSYHYNNNNNEMCNHLKQVYQVFEAACQGQEKKEKEALLEYNSSIYKPLFSK